MVPQQDALPVPVNGWMPMPMPESESADRDEWEELAKAAAHVSPIYAWELGGESPTLLELSRYLDWMLWGMKRADDLTVPFSQLDIAKTRDFAAKLEERCAALAAAGHEAEGRAEKPTPAPEGTTP
jgi:hypothetical protein